MGGFSGFVRVWTVAAAGAAIGLAGCTTSTDVRYETAPPPDVRIIAVDRILAGSPEWERLARRLRRDLIKALEQDAADIDVMAIVPARLPPDALIIAGTLDEAETGNELFSTLIGYGVGGATLKARFTVRGNDGVEFADFETSVNDDDPSAESVFVGGFGTHLHPLYLDDLTEPLADEVAAEILNWMDGESLN